MIFVCLIYNYPISTNEHNFHLLNIIFNLWTILEFKVIYNLYNTNWVRDKYSSYSD